MIVRHSFQFDGAGCQAAVLAAHDENFATEQEYGNSLCRADWYVIQSSGLCSLCISKVTQQARANITNRVAVIEDPSQARLAGQPEPSLGRSVAGSSPSSVGRA